MSSFTPVGVEATVKNFSQFNSQLNAMRQAIAQTGQSSVSMGQQSSMGSEQLMGLGLAAGTVTGGIGTLGMMVAMAAIEIGKTLVNAVTNALTSLVSLGQNALMVASRFKEMWIAAQFVGQQAGFSAQEIDRMIASMKDAGVRTDVAASALTKFAQAGLDITQLGVLTEIAQGSAILAEGGADSSETLQRLIYSITTLQPEVAKTAGVTTTFQGAMAKLAAETGRTTDQLTIAEKQTAAMNAIIEAGTPLLGLYDQAMGTAGKQMRSLEGRIIPELMAALGAPFQDAFYTIVKAVSDLVAQFTAMVSEGGVLYPVLTNLGAAAAIAADGFKWLVDQGLNFLKAFGNTMGTVGEEMADGIPRGMALAEEGFQDESSTIMHGVEQMLSDIADTFASYASEAFQWGANMVVALADGIIQAANTVLVAAINVIGSILGSWLGPGSPPRVAPDIDQWGLAAMAEYLRGFTMADFGILTDLQRTLKGVLSGPEFAQISKELIVGLGGGGIDAGIFDRIAKAAGEYGNEVAELAQRQIMLAVATEQVRESEARLTEAQRQASSAQDKVLRLRREYNAAVRAGADPATLRAKLAELNAAERERQVADDNLKVAEDSKKNAEDQIDVLAQQTALQDALVKQLQELAKAEAGAGKAGGGGGGGAKPKLALPKGLAETKIPELGASIGANIKSAIDRAIEGAKAELTKKLGEIFGPALARWNAEVMPALNTLLTNFQAFAGQLQTLWNDVVMPTLIDTWNNDILPIWEQAQVAFGVLMTTIQTGLGYLSAAWTEHGSWIMYYVTFVWDFIRAAIGVFIELIKGNILVFLDILSGDWEKAWTDIQNTFVNISGFLLDVFRQYISDFLISAMQFIEDFLAGWNEFWANVQTALSTAIEEISTYFNTWFSDLVDDMKTFGGDMVKGLKDGWNQFWGGFISNVEGKIRDFVDWIRRLLNISSPSKVFADIGMNMALGLQEGWADQLTEGFKPIGIGMAPQRLSAPSRLPSAAAAAGAPAIQIGDVYIGSDMDMAAFEARVTQAVRRGMGYG